MKNTNKIKLHFLVLAFVAGIIIGLFTPKIYTMFTKKDVGKRVKRLYELANPGLTIELVDVLDEGSMYRVLLKTRGSKGVNYIEVYVTKDGKFLTEGVIFVKESIEQIQKLKDFVDCLENKGVKIYGLSNHTATLLQLNLLGRYSTKLYVSCDGDNLQSCINAGVTQVPSVVINGKVEPGVKTIEWFERQTGCKFEK